MNGLLCGMPIRTSEFLGKTITPQAQPLKLGPYYQRRVRKWLRKHPPYTVGNGQFFIVQEREIWCHPDDLRTLESKLRDAAKEKR